MGRRRASVLVIVAGALVALHAGCGDEASDIADACTKACALDADHPCATDNSKCKGTCHDQCLADCQALSSQARQQSGRGAECGDCIAAQFTYVTTPGNSKGCWGVDRPDSLDEPACRSKCSAPTQ